MNTKKQKSLKSIKFDKETLDSLAELVGVLKEIHVDLVSKGWIITKGEFIPPPGYVPPQDRSRKRKASQE